MFKTLKLDDGIYQEASSKKVSIGQYLEDLYEKESGEQSTYKDMSPVQEHKYRTECAIKGIVPELTAIEKQLIAQDIKVAGPHSDLVEKFYTSGQSTALFPAYVSQKVLMGIMAKSPISDFVMAETNVKAVSYEKTELTEIEAKRQTKKTVEGSDFTELKLSTAQSAVKLQKFGAYLSSTYEAIRYAKIDIVGKFLEKVGMQIGIDEFDELIGTLINGDGNNNAIAAGTTYEVLASGSIALGDVIGWATKLPTPYKMDRFVGRKALLAIYYTTVAGMTNAKDQFGFMQIEIPRAYEWDRTIALADEFYGVDSRFAIEYLVDGGVTTEYEKIIRKQLNGVAISKRAGFAIFDKNAIAKLDYTH